MPPKHLSSYLLTHRLASGLTQRELGELLGISQDAVSLYELEKRPLSARSLIACELIFGVRGSDLFPAFYETVEESLAIRALALHDQLASREDPVSKKKFALISGIPGRLRDAKEA